MNTLISVKLLDRVLPEFPCMDHEPGDAERLALEALCRRCWIFEPNGRPTMQAILNDQGLVDQRGCASSYLGEGTKLPGGSTGYEDIEDDMQTLRIQAPPPASSRSTTPESIESVSAPVVLKGILRHRRGAVPVADDLPVNLQTGSRQKSAPSVLTFVNEGIAPLLKSNGRGLISKHIQFAKQ